MDLPGDEHRNKKTTVAMSQIEKLNEALEYAESILATIREPLIVLDADLRIISANQSYYSLFSVNPEDTEGKLIYEISNGQWDIPKLRKLLEQIIPRNTYFNDFEIEHIFPKIGNRKLLFNARRLHNGNRQSEKILLAIEDTTERKRLEHEIISSELRYRRLFETAQDGILLLDAKTGQITDVNPFLIDMLGYSKEELLGKKLWEIGPFRDIEVTKTSFLELQTKKYIRYDHLPLETKDRQSIDVEFVSNVYHVNNSKVIQCNVRDITERKKLDDFKDEFIGLISHELRTPLTVILGALNVLRTHEASLSTEDRHQLIQDAILESEELSTMLTNLLELSRAQAGRLSLHSELISIDKVVRNKVVDIKQRFPKHQFSVDLPKKLPKVNVDIHRLGQILHNLLDNAVKYSLPGGKIYVFAKEDNKQVVIGVRDNGRGISLPDQKKLFRPFQRIVNGAFEHIGGTGLGLLVCRRLVEAHGGHIWVESRLHEGATFLFTIPSQKKRPKRGE